jgi:hypothetical protein
MLASTLSLVNINSVLGSGINIPRMPLPWPIGLSGWFSSTLGIIHDSTGQLRPLSEFEQSIYQKVKRLGKRSYARFDRFQKNIVQARPNHWRCRAGARYLYICEDGLVHYCSQQRGYPAIPLTQYTPDRMRREFNTRKSCAPLCTVSCVQQVAMLDNWRKPQTLGPETAGEGPLVQLLKLEFSSRIWLRRTLFLVSFSGAEPLSASLASGEAGRALCVRG